MKDAQRAVRPERISAILKILKNEGFNIAEVTLSTDGTVSIKTTHNQDSHKSEASLAMEARRARKRKLQTESAARSAKGM